MIIISELASFFIISAVSAIISYVFMIFLTAVSDSAAITVIFLMTSCLSNHFFNLCVLNHALINASIMSFFRFFQIVSSAVFLSYN